MWFNRSVGIGSPVCGGVGMGLEATCQVRHAGQASTGKARLEEKELFFRGDFRLKIPFAELTQFEAKDGSLRVEWPSGEAFFDLGSKQAEKWYLKIRYPRNLIDKLGVKPGQRVMAFGVDDANFWKLLRDRTQEIATEDCEMEFDWVFARYEDPSDLAKLPTLRNRIRKTGAIWVLWPKGRPRLKEDHVRAAALGCGLVDVKVVSFSETLSGLKLMIPKRLR